MKKTSQRELDPRDALLLKQTEELRIHLLGNDGVRGRVSSRARNSRRSVASTTAVISNTGWRRKMKFFRPSPSRS